MGPASRFSKVFRGSLAFFAVLAAAACTPSIGDKCVLSTDCSVQGNLVCDNAQPGGYCTMLNCSGNSCPGGAGCVLFNAAVQGCAYTDRSISRTGRTFCMAQCHKDSDCRGGYICADPRLSPWNAILLDDAQNERVCIVPPDDGMIGGPQEAPSQAPVCQPAGPGVPELDASTAFDAGADADATVVDGGGADAASDATVEDAADAGSDGGGDAGDQDAGSEDAATE
jgi:hypothetical protein